MEVDADFWNELAERYSKKPIDDVPAYERKLEITKAQLKPHHVILDIGCGTGSLALELAPHVSKVHAVDVSKEMLRIGREKAAASLIDNIEFHESTAEELPVFEAASFDGVCAYNIIHLVKDRPGLLRQVMLLLKPGGFFVSTTPCAGDSWVPYKAILAVMKALGKAPFVDVIKSDLLLSEMRAVGFEDASRRDVGAKATTAFILANKRYAPALVSTNEQPSLHQRETEQV